MPRGLPKSSAGEGAGAQARNSVASCGNRGGGSGDKTVEEPRARRKSANAPTGLSPRSTSFLRSCVLVAPERRQRRRRSRARRLLRRSNQSASNSTPAIPLPRTKISAPGSARSVPSRSMNVRPHRLENRVRTPALHAGRTPALHAGLLCRTCAGSLRCSTTKMGR